MSTNEHTGARLVSKIPSDEYKENYEKIFGKSKERNHDNNCDACVSSRHDMDCCETVNEEGV